MGSVYWIGALGISVGLLIGVLFGASDWLRWIAYAIIVANLIDRYVRDARKDRDG